MNQKKVYKVYCAVDAKRKKNQKRKLYIMPFTLLCSRFDT